MVGGVAVQLRVRLVDGNGVQGPVLGVDPRVLRRRYDLRRRGWVLLCGTRARVRVVIW